MLIGEVMELTPNVSAAHNMATRLADKVRNLWLENKNAGNSKWEENFFEDSEGIAFLREENFCGLVGIDYIFRWWGHSDPDGLAGDLQVLWKCSIQQEMRIYKTTIRFAERDFKRAKTLSETSIREEFRSEFRNAFDLWQTLYQENVQ